MVYKKRSVVFPEVSLKVGLRLSFFLPATWIGYIGWYFGNQSGQQCDLGSRSCVECSLGLETLEYQSALDFIERQYLV